MERKKRYGGGERESKVGVVKRNVRDRLMNVEKRKRETERERGKWEM